MTSTDTACRRRRSPSRSRPFTECLLLIAGAQPQARPSTHDSSSRWHLAEPLLDFLGANGLPLSSIALKQVRLNYRTRLDIVRPVRDTKPPLIDAILTKYPGTAALP